MISKTILQKSGKPVNARGEKSRIFAPFLQKVQAFVTAWRAAVSEVKNVRKNCRTH